MRLRTLTPRLAEAELRRVLPEEKTAESFYTSPAWLGLLDELYIERFGGKHLARCEDPECRHPHRRGIRLFGDHIKERRDGGADLDKKNILFRCGSCHSRKTQRVRAERLSSRP